MNRKLLGSFVAVAVLAGACGGGGAPAQSQPGANLTGSVKLDGSSTVFPVSEAFAEEFQKKNPGVRVTVGISGTGGGFKKFCAGETDISDASRPITKAEMDVCKAAGIQFVELPIAFDGLSVMVSPKNSFISCLTVSELKKIWEPEAQGKITNWNQVRLSFPDQRMTLYGAGADSGTFDYFTEAINKKEKASRGDFTASEDDNVLVQGISSDPNALGYFGYAYYSENKDKLKLVGIDNEKGAGCVAPSPETILSGTYQPLSRPIFIYAKVSELERPEVKAFLDFYLATANNQLITSVGYVPLPQQHYPTLSDRVAKKQAGTVFTGVTQTGVKIEDLFSRTPAIP
ncbi:MAG: PstS family phosphate ABC transporter substrate-binding protein [Chloroflexota bacterium]